MNTRHEKDQLSASHFDRKWRETIKLMPQGGDYCFYMRQYGYDIIKDAIPNKASVFDFACGLGVIDAQLAREKKCLVFGCDISKVAVDYANKNKNVNMEHGGKIFPFGKLKYDYILAIYFLEHIPNPVHWIENALRFGQRVIFSIPNNFKRAGEHELMGWHDWDSFYDLFKDFELTRIDEGKYHDYLPECYHHPTFVCEKK